MSTKLISKHKLCNDNLVFMKIHGDYFVVKDKVLLQGHAGSGLYKLANCHPNSSIGKHTTFLTEGSIWHERLAHVSKVVMNKALSSQGIDVFSDSNGHSTSTSCALVKTRRLPFHFTHVNASTPFELLYF